jgi:hypothetical protein
MGSPPSWGQVTCRMGTTTMGYPGHTVDAVRLTEGQVLPDQVGDRSLIRDQVGDRSQTPVLREN